MIHNPAQLKLAILAEGPNGQQQAAIFAEELEFLLRASPGSGKTWTSCRRFLWRVENWQNVDGGMALLSFTNAAVHEFERATNSTKRGAALLEPNFVGTFDSFIERFVITRFGHLIFGGQHRPKLFSGPRPGDWNNKKWMAWVDGKKGKMPIPPWEITPYLQQGQLAFKGRLGSAEFDIPKAEGIRAIGTFLKSGFYTHIQRNFWACHLLHKIPRLAQILARRFPEIIIDEAQDTGIWLIQFLQKLREGGTKITLVGDPDQCIYEFSLASASSLAQLSSDWKLKERPLDKSFRCNDAIANAARPIGCNKNFSGCGAPQKNCENAYVFAEADASFSNAISFFRKMLVEAGCLESKAAIVCRGHDQIAQVRGSARYLDLQGKTRALAEAAFLRDKQSDFKAAYVRIERILRGLDEESEIWESIDDAPDSERATSIRTAIWQFVRSTDRLPPISLNSGEWLEKAKSEIENLLKLIGITNYPKLGTQFKRTGLEEDQLLLPLLEEKNLFPPIRLETIHKVKGEGIDAVLVIASKGFFDDVVRDCVAGNESEERRLCYVAMTRARHLLVVAAPTSHVQKKQAFWGAWGFKLVT